MRTWPSKYGVEVSASLRRTSGIHSPVLDSASSAAADPHARYTPIRLELFLRKHTHGEAGCDNVLDDIMPKTREEIPFIITNPNFLMLAQIRVQAQRPSGEIGEGGLDGIGAVEGLDFGGEGGPGE